MGDYDAFGDAFQVIVIIACISIPLGVWKIVDIILWIIENISISIK